MMRQVKKKNPERRCYLEYDKLYIDGKLFMYSQLTGQVEEQSSTVNTDHQNFR